MAIFKRLPSIVPEIYIIESIGATNRKCKIRLLKRRKFQQIFEKLLARMFALSLSI